MSISKDQNDKITALLKTKILNKLSSYKPETSNMPFHIRLLGKDRMALFSFIQSINTMLGTSIFEQVAVIIAQNNFIQAISQYKDIGNKISQQAQTEIQNIIDSLTSKTIEANKIKEISQVLKVAKSGEIKNIKKPTIDLFLKTKNDIEYYFDLKTAKPNFDEIKGFKRKLLEWVAIRGLYKPDVKINTLLAIPYNPYDPNPYERWTFQGLFDVDNELKVAEDFWNFLGGDNTYNDLLEIFRIVGEDIRPEIDSYFEKFKK